MTFQFSSAAKKKCCQPWLWLSILICFSACSQPQPAVNSQTQQTTQSASPRALTTQFLPNAVQVHANVISGGMPSGDEAFAELKSLGVKTIVSVDGAKPDLERAKKNGLRYVHLPHGYDGVPVERATALAKAVRDLPGPIYIHCHHGKHRSPAAAAVACVGAGLISHDQGLSVLQIAGTSPNYRGLFQSADSATIIDAELLDACAAEFPEIATLPVMAEAMVAIEQTHDRLKMLAANGWQPITTHPDLVPAHEALMLREHFAELIRSLTREPAENSHGSVASSDNAHDKPAAEMVALLKVSESLATDLETELLSWQSVDHSSTKPTIDSNANPDLVPQSVIKLAAAIENDCKSCHQRFRDVPLQSRKSP